MTEPAAPAAPTAGAAPSTDKVKTKAGLWWPAATLFSLINRSVDFYPRLSRNKKSVGLKSPEIISEMVMAMRDWDKLDTSGTDIDDAIELAKASLSEAKAQTEYQDQKATRLLTVTTFLSALSGAFFASFSTNYPLRMVESLSGGWRFALIGAYLTFLLFVLSALSGALVTFHATRTRFKYPATATAQSQMGPTKSYLFFREMIAVTPKGWADSFVTVSDDGGAKKAVLHHQLKLGNFQNYITEAYLIAAKTADKLRYLEPAQSLLAWALRFLLLFVILIALIQAQLSPTPTRVTPMELLTSRPTPVVVQPPTMPPDAPADQREQTRSAGEVDRRVRNGQSQ